MKDEKETKKGQKLRSANAEVLGIDIGTTAVKAVRMRTSRDGMVLVGCVELPAVSLNGSRPEGVVQRLNLPRDFRGCNAGLALTSKHAVVRLLALPSMGRSPQQMQQTIRNQAGLESDFRLGYSVLPGPRGKQETSVLAVGLPNGEAVSALELLEDQAVGRVSLEVAALATAHAFLRSRSEDTNGGAIGLIDAGAAVSCLTVFHKGQPVLLRKFDFGSLETRRRVQRQFGVDEATAENIIGDTSFDISQAIQEAMGPFLRQLAISREFVERKGGVPIKAWYLTGGIAMAGYWGERIRAAVGEHVQIWNPLEGIEVQPGVWPDPLKGHEGRFAAAIGSAVGVLQES
jgi:Tfp pilus assembly PilM family ATPase